MAVTTPTIQGTRQSNSMGQSQPTKALKIETPARRILNRFLRHRLAVTGALIILLLIIMAIAAPIIAPIEPTFVDLRAAAKPPNSTHWLGTDAVGRDVWSRVVYAIRVSLSVGIVSVGISVAIALLLGTISGYFGGWIDMLIMRLTDIILCIPSLVIIMSVVVLVGPSIYNIMVVIGVLGWTGMARLVRGQTLQVRAQDFVLAARSVGARDRDIMLRHVLPNVLPFIIVWITFAFTGVILTETSLSYLGLGVQPPNASWGNLVGAAGNLRDIQFRPWTWIPAGLMITLTVLSLNFIGDALRDALDPHALID